MAVPARQGLNKYNNSGEELQMRANRNSKSRKRNAGNPQDGQWQSAARILCASKKGNNNDLA
jgi:hypothetical protein